MFHSFFPTIRHFNKLPISIRESTNIYVLRQILSCILLFQAPLLFPLIVLITLTYSACSLVLALSYWNIVQLLKK